MFGKRKPVSTPAKKPSMKGFLDPKFALDKPVEFEADAYDQALDQYAMKLSLESPYAHGTNRQSPTKLIHEEPNKYATDLIAKLPSDLSVIHLYADFPHVLNKIALAWGHHSDFYRLMDDLLIDKRGGRTGFPFKTALELSRLAEHYEQYVSKRPKSQWDVVQNAREKLY